MSLTVNQVDKLEHYIAAIGEGRAKLSAWEKSFFDDQVFRWSEYGADMNLSVKQWAILDRMYEKITDNNPRDMFGHD